DCASKGRGVSISDFSAVAEDKGLECYGISDHLHTPYNLDEVFRSKEEFDSLPFNPNFHFGIEVSCVSKWEIDEIESGRSDAATYGLREGGTPGCELTIGITEEDVSEYGIEYVIGGTHWPIYIEITRENVIEDYARQNLFLACHPLVDIVAHPWWWGGKGWKNEEGKCVTDPWLDDFGKIPLSIHDEFAAAVKENKKAVEINLDACVFNKHYPEDFGKQYIDYIAYLHERGVKFSIGSDNHESDYNPRFEDLEIMLEGIGLAEKDLWRLPAKAVNSEQRAKRVRSILYRR
ncbi:MAG: hypothetical protein ACYTFY_23400, partial [Planctomycetota bacterium]